ncbi:MULTISPECIES: cell wall metabolism sensor histidine kinase WalK [unclassified Pseudactinotalea]|uniref:sensor histidine kinase n=1 Tax=unclassified Pseudactinotalea TaxID=2649176 RepID=UPI00128B1848|nr:MULTISPECIES: HAMP domain-containing sensor histidine kinase [unclassified Pseudactinotalea]MPV48842.1 HAMP domain-containing protein [Pseudactinotalea sp. HY160]QGH68819.1 HAMP domain-containing protein [Pseudactinotalea sp. HY158]
MTTSRRGVTARTRILAWILLIVTIAVSVIVVATARSVLAGVQSGANTELTHEAEKFRGFASRPDPATGREFTSVRELLTSHLQHNLPEHSETFFSVIDGVPDRRSGGDPPVRLDLDAAFVAQATAAEEPFSANLSTSAGPVTFAVLPVEFVGDPQTGRLVIVEFLAPELDEAWSTIWVMSVIAVIALALAGATGWFVAGRVLAPIRELSETAARISETDLGRRIEVDGSDDVAQLAETFNRMLDRLETAFDGQRRFLDDAGHELRTPITVIRGHLELMGTDPLERAQTLALVGDELGRMSRLVDDLIVLARSERPDFLLLAPADLTDLVVETFAKATALAARHWTIDETPEVFAVVDAQRLTQALLQLAANAVEHTGADDSVAVGGAVVAGRLRLWVRDSGTGIPPEDQARIFARFARGAADMRAGRGTGLGLAIVDRIAAAHGGHIALDSEPGRGSTFVLDLPWHRPEEAP